MRKALSTVLVLALALALASSFGCAKKKIDSEGLPPGASRAGGGSDEEARLAQERAMRERDLAMRQGQGQGLGGRGAGGPRIGRAQADPRLVQQLENLRIYFDYDSFELKGDSRDRLQQAAELLKANPAIGVVIDGHADERGTEEYNLALGERRARAVYEFLVLMGVSGDSLKMVSYGEESPLDSGHGETAYAKNRRAEFKVQE